METDWNKITTDMAIGAFRDTERTALLLDRKKLALQKLMETGKIDMDRYFEETEKIRAEYEQKREAAGL
jgi:hypothetical protein